MIGGIPSLRSFTSSLPLIGISFLLCLGYFILPILFGKSKSCGLSKQLIFSILERCPETKRIILGTPDVDSQARAVYRHFGFEPYINPVVEAQHKDLEFTVLLAWEKPEAAVA